MSKPPVLLRKSEALQDALDLFSQRTPEALITMVTTKDGLSVASVTKKSVAKEEEMLAVAGAQILDMAVEVNNQLNQGKVGRILIEGAQRTTIVVSAGRDIVLIVVVPADAKLGLTMLGIRKLAQSIAKIYN